MLRIAAVSSDETIRLQLARAFDAAPPSWMVTLHHEAPGDTDIVVCGPDRDVPGAVTFDPERPQLLVPDIAARIVKTGGRTILVVGATGGCGASTVALHLAAVGEACLIEGSGDDLRRRLALDTAKSWSDALSGEPLESSALPVAPGFRVLLSPRTSTAEDVARVLERSVPLFDHVLVDAPAATATELSEPGAIGVLVFAPSRPSIVRAQRIVAENPAMRWALVATRTGPGGSLRGREIERLLERKLAVELPCSAGLRDAEDEGRLLTSPLSPWLWQMKRLWRALATA